MSWIIIIPFVSLGFYLLLFLSLIQRLKETVPKQIFAAILLASAGWSFSSWMMHVGALPSPRFWLVIALVFTLLLNPLMVHFASEYPRRKPQIGWLVLSWYGIALVLEVGNLMGKLVERVELIPDSGGAVNIEFGPMISLGWPYMVLTVFVIAALFVYSRRSINSRAERRLLRYPLLGTLFLFGGGLLNIFPALSGYPFDLLANIAFALTVAYGISQDQFLNLRVLLRRNFAHIILALALSGFFVFMLYVIQVSIGGASGFYLWLMVSPLAAALILLFYALRGRLQSGIDRFFFGKHYDYRQTLLEFSQKMGGSLDLNSLAEDLLGMLCSSLDCDKAMLLLPSAQRDSFEVRVSQGFSNEELSADISILSNDSLLIWAKKHVRPLSKSEVEIIAGPGNVLVGDTYWMRGLDYELMCPLMTKDNVVGFIVLGHKKSIEQYSTEDMLLISTISHQVAVALDNAHLYADSQKAYSELKQTQESLVQSERMQVIGQMAGGVAHDFNNLLTTILTRAELALDKVSVPEAQNDLEIIRRTALDGAQVTRRIQEFARSKPKTEFVPVDINEVIKTTLSLVEHRIAEQQQTMGVIADITLGLRPVSMVLGSAADLRQALFNIVTNAIDAMPNGGRILIATENRGEWVCTSVTDTGTGMSPEIRKRIFEPLFTTKGHRSTGLGLTVVASIIQKHNGKIEVDSEPGKGSTFRLILPAMPSPVSTPSAPAQAYHGQKRGNFLIIDDDKEVLDSLRLTLSRLGHTTACVTNGSDGLALAQQTRFDLVITDLGMPGMGGADVAVCLKDMRPDMPILLITGWGVQVDPKQMKIEGVLSKPFTREEVATAVDRLLKIKGTGPS